MDSTDNIETSAKSNRPETRNAHTEMEAKNEKSIGWLRSFRMNKPKKNNISTNQKSNPAFPMQKSETNIDKFSNVTKKTHPCTVCEACFDKKDELSAHLIERHEYRRTYQCSICKTDGLIVGFILDNFRARTSSDFLAISNDRHLEISK